ncbi:hypothetical protein Lalb_Chr19g0133571 [Lupinus albus]|uniref:Uncharacterized protein n=1 Tax=Lupinus albus TaxID=3870 RepID=A0A6A4P1K8_LUPAL|nr:hypothetical protein Lalb_Chr19g0133571 [Lupinus albus]
MKACFCFENYKLHLKNHFLVLISLKVAKNFNLKHYFTTHFLLLHYSQLVCSYAENGCHTQFRKASYSS